MVSISEKTLFLCGDADHCSKPDEYGKTVRLDTHPESGNIGLKFENISSKLVQEIPSAVKDLLEIASYIYCADQSVSRGGRIGRANGKDWHRDMTLDIAVRNPDIWSETAVTKEIEETISFLSGERYRFQFEKLRKDIPVTGYFHFDEGQPWFDAESVVLFSGGLDSFAGATDEIVNAGRRVALVSHRPVSRISAWQKELLEKFKAETRTGNQLLHIPVWINKESGLTHDVSQRTRSFLYASIGAAVARMYGLDEIKFYENGIVSSNLPLADQIVGSRASRSTHPRFLKLVSNLFSLIFDRKFSVVNPYFFKTKSEVVQVIKDAKLSPLISLTRTCSHVRTAIKLQPHCGMCSQCIERRFATEFAEVSKYDPVEDYATDLFTGAIEKADDKNMVTSYVSKMQAIEDVENIEFIVATGETYRIIEGLGMKPSEAAEHLCALYRRNAEQVGTVMQRMVERYSDRIRRGEIKPNSLLGMRIGASRKHGDDLAEFKRFPTPTGFDWEKIVIQIKSHDSAQIKAGDVSQRVLAADMGFRDKRRGDMLNKQWELLCSLAESDGHFTWKSPSSRPKLQKQISDLNNTLKTYFGLSDNPISWSRRDRAYICRFTIMDQSYGSKAR